MTTTLSQSALAPTYDRSALTTGIVHMGVGNFHRAHQAVYLDQLMRQGQAQDWAICGVGLMPGDVRMKEALESQDYLYSLTEKHPDGHRTPSIIGSIHNYLFAPDDPDAVLEVLSAPETRIVSLTVTESGYNIDDATGEFRTGSAGAQHDAANPDTPNTSFGFIVSALQRRRAAGIPAFTVMSCDNLPGNGKIARTAVVSQAGIADPELAQWIDENVSFPNCMVDRITPVTTETDKANVLSELGVEDAWPVTCEPFLQWVLEDNFPAGRPPFEKVGVHMVEDVVPYELMKLRLLNASHQALAHWGRLLPLEYAHEAAADPQIASWVRAYLEREALPMLLPVPGIDLGEYVDSLFERFTNASIADTLFRLAQDASSRMPKFVLPTVRDNLTHDGPIDLGVAMVAAWALGEEGLAEDGSAIDIDDPLMGRLLPLAQRQKAGETLAFVSDLDVFGDLAAQSSFAQAFTQELAAIREQGVRARLEAMV